MEKTLLKKQIKNKYKTISKFLIEKEKEGNQLDYPRFINWLAGRMVYKIAESICEKEFPGVE